MCALDTHRLAIVVHSRVRKGRWLRAQRQAVHNEAKGLGLIQLLGNQAGRFDGSVDQENVNADFSTLVPSSGKAIAVIFARSLLQSKRSCSRGDRASGDVAWQAAIRKPPFTVSGAKSSGGCGARASYPWNEIGKARIFELVVDGRLELTGHLRAIELAVDGCAVQFLPVGAAADHIKTIVLVALARSADDDLAANGDLRAVDLDIVLDLCVCRLRSHRQGRERHQCGRLHQLGQPLQDDHLCDVAGELGNPRRHDQRRRC